MAGAILVQSVPALVFGCYYRTVRFQSLINRSLSELRSKELFREPDDGSARRAVEAAAAQLGVPAIDASSNDYLGLAGRVVSRETLGNPGAAASRLVHGTAQEHLDLESLLAAWVGAETALLFASAYSANLGLISALGIAETVVISDASNHASLIDGARLAKAEVRIVPHLDLEAMRRTLSDRQSAKACWVVTESYFSMDGDGPDLLALRELCDAYDACLIVDEAHAVGVFGPQGAGRCAEFGVRPDVLTGALGKAVGSHGGFVAGSLPLRTYLWNKARSFVFSTAPSPQHAALTRAQVERVRQGDDLRSSLALNGATLRAQLGDAGLQLATASFGPIVSVILGDNRLALDAAARLRAAGVLAQAIRPPTVPLGSARLRLTVKATFTPDDVKRLAASVVDACRA
ncbi:MAG: 8-amino-7-oxononanoate synthase [Polyangiaceae bacterium]